MARTQAGAFDVGGIREQVRQRLIDDGVEPTDEAINNVILNAASRTGVAPRVSARGGGDGARSRKTAPAPAGFVAPLQKRGPGRPRKNAAGAGGAVAESDVPSAEELDDGDTSAAKKGDGRSLRRAIAISAPNLQTVQFRIIGTAPLVMNKFSARALEKMRDDQAAGSTARKGRNREAKDFEAGSKEATHISEEGWEGLPASAFRNGLISACRLVDFKMTLAKLSVFVEADGYENDKFGRYPLVKITKGKPQHTEFAVRNATGVADIRPRPMWVEGWEARPRITFDADLFKLEDITNLLSRMGQQVGIGAGRPDSKDSTGMGWGTFRVGGTER